MRWLLPIIRHSGTITYGRAADRLAPELGIEGRIFPVHIGGVVGALEHRLLEFDANIPLINVLVVDTSGRPGSGIDEFLRTRYGRWRSARVRRDICARAAAAVYKFEDWEGAYTALFGTEPPRDTELQTQEKDGKSPDGRGRGDAEGPEHRKLKLYVRDNPLSLDLPASTQGKEEFQLLSGDEVDVRFIDETRTVVVEVKSIISGYNDLRRGIYQCVKYRAVMDAQLEGVSGKYVVSAILVTENELPGDLKALAKRLEVMCKCVRVN